MFYIKRFIYHRQFSLSLNPIDLCLSGCGQPDRVYFSAMCKMAHLGPCGCERDLDEDEMMKDYEVYNKVRVNLALFTGIKLMASCFSSRTLKRFMTLQSCGCH